MPSDLDERFEISTHALPDDEEGEVVWTLIHHRAPQPTTRAVLYVHGFVDYFFQVEMAERYVAAGFDFYAIDLRKYGRSLRPHQTPNVIGSIPDYFAELDAAIALIRERDGHERVLLSGHSTGGLTCSLYADHVRARGTVDAVFLNSPFFEFSGGWLTREALVPLAGAVGSVQPQREISGGLSEVYGQSLHRDHHGEWDYDLALKPIEGFPLRAGWIRAIRGAQRTLQSGLDIDCPVLVMCSTRSSHPERWEPIAQVTDTVLDVTEIERHAGALGRHVTRVRIADGMHDLVLSGEKVRARVYDELFTWLAAYLPAA